MKYACKATAAYFYLLKALMKILALETSTNACSAALIDGTQQNHSCIERFEIAPRMHTQLILPMIDSVLKEAGFDIKDVDVLAFGRGPGAFTGVRVGTGVIQALSYGAGIPVAQISSLAALAQRAYHQSQLQIKKILLANDARMKEIYCSAYELVDGFMTSIGSEEVMKPENLGQYLSQQSISIDNSYYQVGNAWSEYSQQLIDVSKQCRSFSFTEDLIYPHAREVAYLAFKEAAENKLLKAEDVSPVYLRNNIAKKKSERVKN